MVHSRCQRFAPVYIKYIKNKTNKFVFNWIIVTTDILFVDTNYKSDPLLTTVIHIFHNSWVKVKSKERLFLKDKHTKIPSRMKM